MTGSKEKVSIRYPNFLSSGISSSIWEKSNGLRSNDTGSCFIPIVPPVYTSNIEVLSCIMSLFDVE